MISTILSFKAGFGNFVNFAEGLGAVVRVGLSGWGEQDGAVKVRVIERLSGGKRAKCGAMMATRSGDAMMASGVKMANASSGAMSSSGSSGAMWADVSSGVMQADVSSADFNARERQVTKLYC